MHMLRAFRIYGMYLIGKIYNDVRKIVHDRCYNISDI